MTGRAEEILKSTGIAYSCGVDLAGYSTFGIHSTAALMAFPVDSASLTSLLLLLDGNGVRYRVIGGMSNTMPSTDYYDGVIVNTRKVNTKTVAENKITAECGATLTSIVRELARHSLGGLEPLYHIPGTLGGAIYGNAGAHGLEISDVLVDATCYSKSTRQVSIIPRAELRFSYRTSRLKSEPLILIGATLAVDPRTPEQINGEIERLRILRENQPRGVKTLGSTFKRVNGVSAGYYIDRVGLKGASVGGAAVSDVHAGFIINRGGATYRDVIDLIALVKTRVQLEFGITLEEEICFL